MAYEWSTYRVSVLGEELTVEAAVWFPSKQERERSPFKLEPETSYRSVNGTDTRFVERSEDWWCALDEALFSARL
jgi:hypothetical protein